MGIFKESVKGGINGDVGLLVSDKLIQNSIASPVNFAPVFSTNLLDAPAPKNVDYRNRKTAFYIDQYSRASYYFNHCSILSTVILRITQEALRNGLDWKAKFQCKCPKCGQEYPRSTKKCTNCGFEGEMIVPDETQKKLLVNWKGGSLIDEANRNGWDLLQLVRSFLILALTYNQPVILCKSTYAVDPHGNAVFEFPQEFVPVDPSKAEMIYDDTGAPGDGRAFCLFDRKKDVDLSNPDAMDSIYKTGYYQDRRYYMARWCLTETDGGGSDGGEYYAEQEIYHDTYILPSLHYGQPLCLLVEADVRAWMALELRNEKYFSTGHPQGVFVVNNISPESTATLQQSIRMQMREDPYNIPMLGIPPASDKVTSTKWHPFAADPTEAMIAVKQELLQRISSIFGMSGLFLGDTEAMRGNGNESHQVALLDRNLVGIRAFGNKFLKWILSKYRITDWELKIVEPPDNQSVDEAEKFNKQLLNAKLAKDLGFEIISQSDGKIEISATPKSYDPIASLFENDGGGKQALGIDDDTDYFKQSMSKTSPRSNGDLLKTVSILGDSSKGMSVEDMLIDAVKKRRISVNDLYYRK